MEVGGVQACAEEIVSVRPHFSLAKRQAIDRG